MRIKPPNTSSPMEYLDAKEEIMDPNFFLRFFAAVLAPEPPPEVALSRAVRVAFPAFPSTLRLLEL